MGDFRVAGIRHRNAGTPQNSLDALRNATATSYYKGDGSLWVKLVSNGGGARPRGGRGGVPLEAVSKSAGKLNPAIQAKALGAGRGLSIKRSPGRQRLKTTTMRDGKVDFDTVLDLGALLPGVKASASARGVALKLKGQLVACTAIHPSASPNSLMVCIDFPARDSLLAKQPDTYYMTPHYQGYATVLVRLAKIGRPELRNLLEQAAQFVGAQRRKRRKRGENLEAGRAS